MNKSQRIRLLLEQMIYKKTLDSSPKEMPYQERIKEGTRMLRIAAEMAIKLADEKMKTKGGDK